LTSLISLFPNTQITKNPEFIEFGKVLINIKTGANNFKEITEKVRTALQKDIELDKRNPKNELIKEKSSFVKVNEVPNYPFSVQVNYRTSALKIESKPKHEQEKYKNLPKVVKHIGILQIDVDNLTESEFIELWNKFKNDNFILFMFRSISGKGIKAGIMIEESTEKHLENFLKAEKYFLDTYGIQIDKQTKDLIRVCYISYDPDLYINYNAELFYYDYKPEMVQKSAFKSNSGIQVFANMQKCTSSKVKNHIINTVNRTIKNAVVIIESATQGDKHGYRLKGGYLIGGYIAGGLMVESEVLPILEMAVRNNTSLPVEKAMKDIYDSVRAGKTEPINEYTIESEYIDYVKKQRANRNQKTKPKNAENANLEIKEDTGLNTNQTVNLETGEIIETELELPFCFWYEFGKELKISFTDLYNYFISLGIQRIKLGKKDIKELLVLIENNIVKEITISDIKTILFRAIETLPFIVSKDHTRNELRELILKGINVYVSTDKMPYLPLTLIELFQDSKEFAYFFFKNGFVVVSKSGYEVKPYTDLKGYIWESQILDYEVTKITDRYIIKNFCYYRFIKKICSFKENDNDKKGKLDDNRHISLMCVIGFLLHTYKKTAYKKAIVFTESNLSEVANGGSGKGLTLQAIGYLRKTRVENAKSFDFKDKFCYQSIDLDTMIFVIDDVEKTFDFEQLFSPITEGVSVEKKGRDKFYLEPEKAPKFVVTSNFAIKNNSGSSLRRKFEMELSTFFNSSYKPIDYFKKDFFFEWTENEWNIFFNVMFCFMQVYFQNDCIIPEYTSKTVQLRKLTTALGKDFLSYANEIVLNQKHTFLSMYDNYRLLFDYTEKDCSKKKFNYLLRTYCEFNNYELIDKLEYVDGHKTLTYTIKSTDGINE